MTAAVTGGGSSPVYVGTRWTRYLRAPDQFIRLTRDRREHLVPLTEIADIRYNVKSGADSFFYVKDVTAKASDGLSDSELKERYGIPRGHLGRLRIVETRDKYRTVLEDEVLRPTVFNLMGLRQIRLTEAECPRRMFVAEGTPEELKQRGLTRALAYIKRGEALGFNRRPTCKQRVRTTPPFRYWYELRPEVTPCLLWSQAWGFRHIVPECPPGITANKRLFRVLATGGLDQQVLAAVLNSTWAASWKYHFGRFTGQEGYFDTDVIAAEQLLVPNPRKLASKLRAHVLTAYESMERRSIGPLHITEKIAPNGRRTKIGPDDLLAGDRRALDEGLAMAMGMTADEASTEVDELYGDLRDMFDAIRSKELLALRGKASGGGGRLTNEGIADIVYATVPDRLQKTVTDFLRPDDEVRMLQIPEGMVTVGTHLFGGAGLVPIGSVEVDGQIIDCGGDDQARWVEALAICGIIGDVPIPVDSAICQERLEEFDLWRDAVVRVVTGMIREQVPNPRRQTAVQQLVVHRVLTNAPRSSSAQD